MSKPLRVDLEPYQRPSMKNNLARSVMGLILLGGFVLVTCNPSLQAELKPADCGLKQNAPNFPRPVTKGKEYTFKTHNSTNRKIKMILASKNGAGKLTAIKCVEVNRNGGCDSLKYSPLVDETVFITYRYKDWAGIFYWTIDSVKWENSVEQCEDEKGMVPKSVKCGCDRKHRGTGTASTTIDEK